MSASASSCRSNNNSVVGTATLDSVTVVSGPPNALPSVAITSPSDGASFTDPASISIDASASDSDGSVSRVDFFDGTTLLGSDTSTPYSYTWNSPPAGTHSLTAVATDNIGATATSSPVTISVSYTPTTQLPLPWTEQDVGRSRCRRHGNLRGGRVPGEGLGHEHRGRRRRVPFRVSADVGRR